MIAMVQVAHQLDNYTDTDCIVHNMLDAETFASIVAAPFNRTGNAREYAPCAECGEPHAIDVECYQHGAHAAPMA